MCHARRFFDADRIWFKQHVPAVRAILSESNDAVTDALYRQACNDKGLCGAVPLASDSMIHGHKDDRNELLRARCIG